MWQSDVHYCDTLKKCFEQYGKPNRVHTDNGGLFVSQCNSKIFLKITNTNNFILIDTHDFLEENNVLFTYGCLGKPRM